MKLLYNNNRMSFYCFLNCPRSFFVQEVALDDVESFFSFNWKYATALTGVYISFHYFKTFKKTSLIYICIHNRENKLNKKADEKANTAACTHKSIDPTEAPASKIISSRTFPGKVTLAQLHYLKKEK